MEKLTTLLKKVQDLNIAKKYDEVIELLPTDILEKHKNADLYAEKAAALGNLERYQECEIIAQKAIEIDKECAKGYNSLGIISRGIHKDDLKAEKYFLKAITIAPKYKLPYNGLGNLYKDKKEYDKAEKYYLKAIEIDPKYPSSYNGLGNTYKELKKYDKAQEFYMKAIEIDSNYVLPYNGLGNLFREIKKYDKAEEFYMKAIEIDPKHVFPYNGLGNLYYDLKNYKKAEEYYLKAIELDYKYLHPYNGLGNIYYNLKDYTKAEEYYIKIIKLDSKFIHSYNGLGSVFYDLKKYDKAEEYFNIALEINPNFDAPYHNLGLLYYVLKKYDLAKAYFSKSIQLKTNDDDFYYKYATSKIEEIDKILENSSYKKITGLVSKIKDILLFTGECVTHYSSISASQYLILKDSPLRLSEGSFLNDTSEGQELFSFLVFSPEAKTKCQEEIFTKRPFIGSFVDISKRNDLTLWRMYGKEALEEAKGCSITLNVNELKQSINAKIKTSDALISPKSEEIEFYRVAYRSNDSFHFAGATASQTEEFSKLMNELKNEVELFKNKTDKNPNEEVDIIELLNSIAYLFKSVEYQYENEIRLVINEAIGFDIKIDLDSKDFKPSSKPNKVYIELVSISKILKDITIGPKVDRAEEWASTFHYHLLNQGLKPEIHISKLPFK